jgi:EAL domain-containing protein (putative c-di-GMP-specific phosphodiesterase class I)
MIGEDGEIVAPAAFIPAAERYDLMGHIDRWVIKATLRGHAERIRAEPGLTISINLSANSLSDPLLWPFLAGELLASGIPPGQVHLEITETALINNLSAAGHLVNAARAAGCKIVLDDFGSGLSSFSYLRRYPIDYLKIDGSFIRQLKDNPIDFAIVESINEIAHKLGAETVAECVEDAATIGIVQAIGVDHAQGFAIAMPKPIEQALGEAPSAPTLLRVVGR